MEFPKNFLWGTAASAYQIEGRDTNDGKGDHIWNIYEREPGHIYENQTGDIACDHIHRFKEDVAIMKKMGLKAYRFSWIGHVFCRREPDGSMRQVSNFTAT